ncbi:MAG TPA: signal peptidase I [Bryobacteraceae bacterium]|nr:signal peptidase I [Bryobacteraceae bacterium]
MMPQSSGMRWLCRVYGALLYAYPREFRLEYGAAMQQVFRDRCRDAQRTEGLFGLLRFALHTAADWVSTTVRESPVPRAAVEHVRAVWSAGRRQAPRSFVSEWVVTILLYLFAATTLVQAYVVPTGSMEGTVRVGDHMLVDRMTYAKAGPWARHVLPYRDLQRGDIVCFLYPEDVRQTYVKRVIGLPGDHIRLVNKQVIRNGRRLIEPYTQHVDPSLDAFRDNFPDGPEYQASLRGLDMLRHHVVNGEVVVPPDMFFAMGDNRDNSSDSRFWGFVPRSYVVGKPVVIYWSFDAPTSDLEGWSIDHVLDVTLHFFTKTRWDRMLLVPRAQKAQEVAVTP